MSAAPNTQPRARRDEVEFPLNVGVVVALKFPQGRITSGRSGERVLFTLVDDRVMFLDPEVAGQITALAVNVREPFTITKTQLSKSDPVSWSVARIASAVGEQPDGTFAVPKLPGRLTNAAGNAPSLDTHAPSSKRTQTSARAGRERYTGSARTQAARERGRDGRLC